MSVGDGQEISATVTQCRAYRKVAGVKTCRSPMTFGGYGTTFTFFRRVLGDWDLYQWKDHPRLPNTNFCSISICHHLARIPWRQIMPPFWGIRVDLRGRKWYQSKCSPHIPVRLLYTRYTIGLSCTVWPQYTTQQTNDRWSDRNRYHSIGNLIII